MFLVAGGIGVAALGVGLLLGPKRPNPAKLDAYESGIPASGTARERFPIHFYLVAMIFIIFDLEAAFFYPLAVKFREAPQFLFRSEEHTSELQSRGHLVCRLLLEKTNRHE